jgi:hypothetical protein
MIKPILNAGLVNPFFTKEPDLRFFYGLSIIFPIERLVRADRIRTAGGLFCRIGVS